MLSILLTCIASAISSTTLEDILTKLTLIDFVCFSKDKNIVNFSIQSEEERIITGPIMIPDYPIIRNVDGYQFYVKYSRETIKEMAEKMLKDGTFNNVDTHFELSIPLCNVYSVALNLVNVVESTVWNAGAELQYAL